MSETGKVTIVEVGPRDGFQVEKTFIPTALKIRIIDAISGARLPKIEATSFVHPRVIPQMQDAEEVMGGIRRCSKTQYAALVPNLRGAQRAIAASVNAIRVVLSASESTNQRNVRMSVADSIRNCTDVYNLAQASAVQPEAVIAVAFGCPFEGDTPLSTLSSITAALVSTGFTEICLADTVGLANPTSIRHKTRALRRQFPGVHFALHLHNTRGLGLANVVAGLEEGIDSFDSSIGGLGGCPVVTGGKGNIATEDLVNMLSEMGIETGVDLDAVRHAARIAQQFLQRPLPSFMLEVPTRQEFYRQTGDTEQAKSCREGGGAAGIVCAGTSNETENTKKSLGKLYAERGFSGRVGFGLRPAIIVVDFILGFTDQQSPLAGNLDAPLAETVRILELARRRAVPVLFTTVEYDARMKDAGLFPKKVAGLSWLISGSRWVELDLRLHRQADEILIRKKYASAFFGTDLASVLAAAGVDTLIITGCTTSGCVRATAVDALQHGLHTIVPKQAVGDRALLPHEANLFDIDAKYGDVVSVQEVLHYLEGLTAAHRQTDTAEVSGTS